MLKTYATLEELGASWVQRLETASLFALLGGILLGFIFGAVDSDWLAILAGSGAILSLLLELTHHFVFYNRISCPECGGKLNRFKNGKNVPAKQAYTQLNNGYGCRHCGWKPMYSQSI